MDSPFAFHQFPYRPLSISIPRRDFLMALMKEVNGTTNAARMKPVFRMADLGELTLEEVMGLTPSLFPGIKFKKDKQFVVAKAPRHKEYVQLCPRGSSAHTLLQLFNNDTTLQSVSEELSQSTDLPLKLAMEYTRGFFLFLVEQGFAYPVAGMPNES